MLIDPFTVIAQVVNLALLVWILSRLLYGPVTRAMEAREARIREEMEAARALRTEAAAEGERYRALVATFESERESRLGEVRAEADFLRQDQARQARAEIGELRERWSQALERDKEAFLRELRTQVGRGSLDVIRSALEGLAGADLDGLLVERFVQRLEEMEPADREALAGAARQEDGPVRLRSASPISDAHRTAVTRALTESIGADTPVSFDIDPALVAGVELRAGGLMVAWTLDDHLQALERAMRSAFDETMEMVGSNGEG